MSKNQETMGNALEVGDTLSKEVSVGYKRTEVGVIPEEWDVTTLGKITTITTGHTPPTHHAANYGDEYPFVSPIDLGGAKYVVKTAKMLSKKGFGISQRFPANSILFVCIGSTIGKCGIAPIELTSNQQINAVLPSPSFSTDYLYYTICLAVPRIKALAGEQAVPIVNKTQFAETVIPLAPFYEQRAIAEALSDMDGLLAALETLIAKKRAIKQAAMQQLLTGKTRLPGFDGDWETKRLEEMVDCLDHVRIPLNEIQRASMLGPYPYCGANGVLDYVNDFVLDDDVILIAEDGGYFDEYVYRPIAYRMSGKIWVNNHAHILKAKLGFNQGFLYFSLVHKNILPYLASGTRAKLNRSEMNKIEIYLPLHSIEQKAIASILSDMDAEIAALEQRRDKASAIKQGMMQQLLTGRIRLVQPETTKEELAVERPVGRQHNWQFNEAVVISVLAKHFGNEQYPLGRMRYTKLSYLLHRHKDGYVEGYIKKAAGPYNPQTRYGGPEKIALQKDYVRQHRSDRRQGFIASTNFDEAESYFDRWYESEALQWLEQFRYKTNGDLELLTTVDMAVEELYEVGGGVSVESVKDVILSNPEWKPKLDRPIFSDANLARAIEDCQKLFDY